MLAGRAVACLAIGSILLEMIFWPVATSPFSLTLLAFFFACIAAGNDLFGLLSTTGAIVLGEISFSIYVLHGIILNIVFVDGSDGLAALPVPGLIALLPAVAGIVMAVTLASYRFIERPIDDYGRRLATRAFPARRHDLTEAQQEIAP